MGRIVAKQSAGGQYHAAFQGFLGQEFAVYAGWQARPDEHPAFIRHGQFAPAAFEPLFDAPTGFHQALHHAFAVLGVAAFAEHAVDDLFEQFGGDAAAHQFHVGQVGGQLRGGGDVADAGVGTQDL